MMSKSWVLMGQRYTHTEASKLGETLINSNKATASYIVESEGLYETWIQPVAGVEL